MEIKFTKMHGIGNDYIYINCLQGIPDIDINDLSVKMSARHFSVGSDGVVLICPSDIADFKMRMFNADGSEGKMCGNAIRCVGKYVYDNKITDKDVLDIETLSGIKHLYLTVKDGAVMTVRVDMGKAMITPESLPVKFNGPMINEPITVLGKEYKLTAVSMGNPHAVTFVKDVKGLDLLKIGPSFENLEIFPERVNTEFVKVIGKNHLEMRVWERGSGETYACGTGACATAVAAILNGFANFNTPITVSLLGGDLLITVAEDFTVFMTGTATKVYDGIYEYNK